MKLKYTYCMKKSLKAVGIGFYQSYMIYSASNGKHFIQNGKLLAYSLGKLLAHTKLHLSAYT